MRFGIMDMQIGALIPAGLNPSNAMAHIAGFDRAAHVRRLAEQGFRLIELGGDMALFFPRSFAPETIGKLAELRSEMGLSYTVHLPLWSSEPSTPLQPVRKGTVAAMAEIVNATSPLEPLAYVLHATGALAAEFYRMTLPPMAAGLLLNLFQVNARQSIAELLEATGLPPRRLAVETIEFPFELTLELAEAMDLSLCLDTGHVLAGFAGPIDLFDALERMLPRLGEVHLHDAPWQGPDRELRYGQDHRPLGAGDLDTARLLGRLQQAGYAGPVIFELTVEEAQRSLAVVRKLGFDYEV